MLKLPLQFDNLGDVRALFVTCCVLHNMLLEYDREDVCNSEDGLHSDVIIGNTMCGFNFCLFDSHAHCVVTVLSVLLDALARMECMQISVSLRIST